MPSVSRGVYRWLFYTSATLEDFADRLNHIWTVGLLLLFACIVSWKQGYSQPIACWCPAQFTDSMIRYSESACWDSYIIQYPQSVPDSDMPDRFTRLDVFVSQSPPEMNYEYMVVRTTLYQWLPLIMCFQALLFKLPNVLLYVLHGFSGVSFDKVAGLTKGYENLNLLDRQVLGRQIARYVYRWCRQCGNCWPWRHLTLLWFLVKVLYCVNVIMQLSILDATIKTSDPPRDNATSYSGVFSGKIFTRNASPWKESTIFPRTVRCHTVIRMLRNYQDYEFQCHLPANEFSERAVMFLWVWFVFVAVVTSLGFFVWIVTTLVPVLRKR